MTVNTTAGSKLRITAAAPATYDEAGFTAIFPTPITSSNPVIGEITDFGEFGREYNLVNHNPVSTRGTVKKKGSFNSGSMTLQLGLDNDDAGQQLAKLAAKSDANYYFEMTIQNGDKYFFSGMVMMFKTSLGNVDSITNASITVELTAVGDMDIIEKMAA